MRKVGRGITAVLLLVGSHAYAGAPDSYMPLGKAFDVPVTLKLQEGEAHTTLNVSLGSKIEEKVGGLYLKMDADLAELRNNAQAIVGKGQLNAGCTDRVTMDNVTLTPMGSHVELCGTVHHEHFLCLSRRAEEFQGRQTSYMDGKPIADKVSEESGRLCGAVWLQPDSSGKALTLRHEILVNELGSQLMSLNPSVDVANVVFGDRLNTALAGLMSVPTPKPLTDYNLSLLDAAFGPGKDGNGLVLTARQLVPVPEDKIGPLIIELLGAANKQAGT